MVILHPTSWSQTVSDLHNSRERPTLVMLTQPSTCVPCRRLKPHIEAVAEQRPDIQVVIVDLDAVPEAIEHYGIMRVPTLFFHAPSKVELQGRTVGALLNEIDTILSER